MTDPCEQQQARGGLDRPAPGGGAASAGAAHGGVSAVRGAAGRFGAGGRRRVVCGGVRGVFAPSDDGVWGLANEVELSVLEGLGGPTDGIGRLRGMGEALAARVAGPGDLVLLGRCLRSVAGSCQVFEAEVPAEMAAAVTAVCAVWDHPNAVEWLCWALAARLEDNLSGAWGVGAGWQGWEAHMADRRLRAAYEGGGTVEGLGDRFWLRVGSHPDPQVRACAQAADPAAGRAVLARLAEGSQPAEVLDIVASHPRTPASALLGVCDAGRLQHPWRVAQNNSAPRRVLDKIAGGLGAGGWDAALLRACWLVAQNPAASRRTLWKLACGDDGAVRSWVAVHPRAGRRALRRLALDEMWWVRQCAAGNPNTPRKALERLCADRRREVRAAAAANPNLPRRLLERLARDRSLVVRAAAAENPDLSDRLVERLASDEHWRVRWHAAMRDGLAENVLRALAGDPHRRVRRMAAQHPACPPDALRQLAADEDRRTHGFAAENPACPPDAIGALARSTAALTRWHAAANPSCPPDALRQLAADGDSRIRREAAQNPACPPDTLDRLASDERPGTRQAAAANPSCPPDALDRLASDGARFVRAVVAANPSTPDRLCERLAGDGRHVVFSAARKTLAERRRAGRDPRAPDRKTAGRAPVGRGETDDNTTKEQPCPNRTEP